MPKIVGERNDFSTALGFVHLEQLPPPTLPCINGQKNTHQMSTRPNYLIVF